MPLASLAVCPPSASATSHTAGDTLSYPKIGLFRRLKELPLFYHKIP